jgi:hypothetical protein
MGIKCKNPLSPNVRKITPSRYREMVEAIFIFFSSWPDFQPAIVI